MKQSEFDDLVKRKFAEFERQNGRVPSMKELSASLGVEDNGGKCSRCSSN